MTQIKRTYEHKTHGAIGAVTLDYPNEGWSLNGTELPADAVAHLANFALQSLQDAYAGAKDLADAQGKFNTKLDRLIKGEIGVRGEGVDSFTKTCRVVAREMLVAQLDADKKKAFRAKDKKAQTDILDKVINDNREVIEKVAKERIKVKANAAKTEIKITL